jgi:hypothetical protein
MAGGREFAGVAGGNVVACFLFDIGFDEERRDVLAGVAGLSAERDAKENAEQKRTRAGVSFVMASSITAASEANTAAPASLRDSG